MMTILASEKLKMIQSNHKLSVSKQAKLLGVNRTSHYRKPKEKPEKYEKYLVDLVDSKFTKYPFFGTRGLRRMILKEDNLVISRYLVGKIMDLLGLETIAPKPFTSIPNKEHKKFPYLLKNLSTIQVNQVWVSDITYIRVAEGFVYLSVVMDWASRKILDFELSNTMDVFLCVDPLKRTLSKYQKPEIFNTDQGSQYTSEKFVSTLTDAQIKVSMDGKGRWMDNVMVERFWRTIKYEEVYPKRYENLKEARTEIRKYIDFYNSGRPHSNLNDKTPDEFYFENINQDLAIAS